MKSQCTLHGFQRFNEETYDDKYGGRRAPAPIQKSAACPEASVVSQSTAARATGEFFLCYCNFFYNCELHFIDLIVMEAFMEAAHNTFYMANLQCMFPVIKSIPHT